MTQRSPRPTRSGDLHLHDLSMLTGYCAGWSLKQLIMEGLGGIPGKITSSPARHLSVLCNQMVNFLGIMQNEWAGARRFLPLIHTWRPLYGRTAWTIRR